MNHLRQDFQVFLQEVEREFQKNKSEQHDISFTPKKPKKIKTTVIETYAIPISYEEKEFLINKIKQLHDEENFYGDYFSVKMKYIKHKSKYVFKIKAKKFIRIGDVNFYS